jgi:hypothetical protein
MRAARFVTLGLSILVGLPLQSASIADVVPPASAISPTEGSVPVHVAMLDASSRNQTPSAFADTMHVQRAGMVQAADSRLSASIANSSIRGSSLGYFGMGATPDSSAGPSKPLSLSDLLLSLLIAGGLIAYQLCRKHRMLRPHPFST